MEFSEENVRIPFEQKELDGVFTVPADVTEECTAMVLTHGAGGDMHIKQLESLAHALARSGVLCLRFTCRAVNFLYRVRAYRAVVDYLRSHERFAPDSIFLGGRSMGARTAVAVCERMCRQKDVVQGVLCLSFPLNLPGKPLTYVERSRDLRELSQTSVMFVSGTADNMCEQRVLQNIMHVMNSPSAVYWVKDANHGLKSTVNMAQEPWNKINIPFPSAVSSIRIPFTGSTDILITYLLADCEKVLTLLCSEVLQTEIRVLYELLYVLNNSFRQHKPFRALKQVEQCVNRLKEMKLQAVVEDLQELCPNKLQRDAGVEVGECDVPSQPMLEWLCLKLLGASSLLARTLDRCSQAFIRIRQHLQLHEFIQLNLVMLSMLSRLWVFFKGVLRALVPMYKRATELLREVSQSKSMAYLTDFTLPGDLKDFLCLSHPDLLMKEGTKDLLKVPREPRKPIFSVLCRLFGDRGQEEDNGEEEREMVPIFSAGHDEGSSLDLGAAVLRRTGDLPYGLDMKVVLQQSCKTTKQLSLEPQMKLGISSQIAVCQKRKFLKSLEKVSSFRNMAAHLKEVMHWCQSCKFYRKRKHLAFLHLKCLRMESLEAEGIRVEKRLKKFKLEVHKALMLQKTFPTKRSCSFTPRWRTRWHRGAFMARNRTARSRSAFSMMCLRTVKNLSVSLKHGRNYSQPQQFSEKEVSRNNMASGAKEEQTDSKAVLRKPNMPKNDIDDIFEFFGL